MGVIPPETLSWTLLRSLNLSKNRVNTPDKLELMKFNANLRKMTLHREKR